MTFWIHDYKILFDKNQLEVWPNTTMTRDVKLNAISRLIILVSLFGTIFISFSMLWIGIISLTAIVWFQSNNSPKETFATASIDRTVPTASNPLMNVLLPEINNNPNRKKAMKSYSPETAPAIMEAVKKNLPDKRLYGNPDDKTELEYSMRNFYTTASSTIPNDQEGFSKFLYGDMPSGKEGNPIALEKHNPRLK